MRECKELSCCQSLWMLSGSLDDESTSTSRDLRRARWLKDALKRLLFGSLGILLNDSGCIHLSSHHVDKLTLCLKVTFEGAFIIRG